MSELAILGIGLIVLVALFLTGLPVYLCFILLVGSSVIAIFGDAGRADRHGDVPEARELALDLAERWRSAHGNDEAIGNVEASPQELGEGGRLPTAERGVGRLAEGKECRGPRDGLKRCCHGLSFAVLDFREDLPRLV